MDFLSSVAGAISGLEKIVEHITSNLTIIFNELCYGWVVMEVIAFDFQTREFVMHAFFGFIYEVFIKLYVSYHLDGIKGHQSHTLPQFVNSLHQVGRTPNLYALSRIY